MILWHVLPNNCLILCNSCTSQLVAERWPFRLLPEFDLELLVRNLVAGAGEHDSPLPSRMPSVVRPFFVFQCCCCDWTHVSMKKVSLRSPRPKPFPREHTRSSCCSMVGRCQHVTGAVASSASLICPAELAASCPFAMEQRELLSARLFFESLLGVIRQKSGFELITCRSHG